MTHCLDFFAHLRKIKYFQPIKVHATADGVRGIYVDGENGQHYEVTVKPVDAPMLKCRLCGEVRPGEEIIAGAGDCRFCALQREDKCH